VKTTTIALLLQEKGNNVRFHGWVDKIRNLKYVQFLIVRQGDHAVQLVNEKGNKAEEIINSLTLHSTILITGKVVDNPNVKLLGLEVQIGSIEITSLAERELPINDNSNHETRMDWRFLDLRSRKNYWLFKIQTLLERALRNYWNTRGCVEIHSPKLMATASESGAELFQVDYFGDKACLAQSPQFYKQMAMAAGLDRVFEVGPVFRANPSFTSRHDTEFTSIDVEISWIDSHADVMDFEEEMIKYAINTLMQELPESLKGFLGISIPKTNISFPRVTLIDAKELVSKTGYKSQKTDDLDPREEKVISDIIKKETGSDFVFITDYPITARPFYHMRHESMLTHTKSFDLLFRGVEITTGAQREHRYEKLKNQVLEKELSIEELKQYLDFFKYGCPPHGGFGFGLTRFLMKLLGYKNVREVTFLYRGPNRLSP